jgi:ankyrin repeat protein
MKFNMKQIFNRSGALDMNLLERLLETTSISAVDVESGQTLLEYACKTNNISLAKLCYRRGSDLQVRSPSGETAFNIATQNKSYRLMECLRMYGVKINSTDGEGKTALHIATSNNDTDAICRLVEWGADVNCRDNNKRTPLHYACIAGHMTTAMFLLELGADLNATDSREYTAVAHAEANDHFQLMDRLVMLGGRGHRLHEPKSDTDAPRPKYGVREREERSMRGKASLGEVQVSPLYLRKNSSLSRIGKYSKSGANSLPQILL